MSWKVALSTVNDSILSFESIKSIYKKINTLTSWVFKIGKGRVDISSLEILKNLAINF